jgi:hypothetical protein
MIADDDGDVRAKTIEAEKVFSLVHRKIDTASFNFESFHVENSMNPSTSLSKLEKFKGKPVLRTGYTTNPSYSGAAELGVLDLGSATEVWTWDSENGSECVITLSGKQDLKSLVHAVAADGKFVGPVDWESLKIRGINKANGVLLALAWDAEDSSKAIAKLITLWPAEVIGKILGKGGLGPEDMAQMGAQVLELADELDVDIDEIRKLSTPIIFNELTIFKSIADAVRRVASNQRRRETLQKKQLEPFSESIELMVKNFLKDKPNRYYPGMGYRIPPAGGASLRKFLINYARNNQALPSGRSSVPYDEGEIGSPRGSFEVDFDQLATG